MKPPVGFYIVEWEDKWFMCAGYCFADEADDSIAHLTNENGAILFTCLRSDIKEVVGKQKQTMMRGYREAIKRRNLKN